MKNKEFHSSSVYAPTYLLRRIIKCFGNKPLTKTQISKKVNYHDYCRIRDALTFLEEVRLVNKRKDERGIIKYFLRRENEEIKTKERK